MSGRLADEELIDVDPDPKLPRVVAGAARPLPSLVDRHGCVRRPPRRVFGRLKPERRHNSAGAQLLDLTPEALHLLDEHLDRAARVEGGREPGRSGDGTEQRDATSLPAHRRGGRRRHRHADGGRPRARRRL